MVQYLPDDHGVFDTCNHLRATTAGPAGLNVNIERPFQSLSPCHRHMALRRCILILTSGNFPVQSMLGTEFNFDFWTECKPRRSTYPACRAVIAAGSQDQSDEIILAIQHAYYLHAMNPSDIETLVTLAEELHLDTQKFAQDLESKWLEQKFERQLEFTRRSPTNGCPSLVAGHATRA
jgi:putative protein-disulfide isomerase